jgi:hypothetical protein
MRPSDEGTALRAVGPPSAERERSNKILARP